MLHDSNTLRLSALTLNTWNCQGDYRKRLGAMERGFRPLAPEIVLLQEVFASRDGSENTARILAAELGLHCAFRPARTKTRRLDGEPILCSSGLAILSRHPIVWSERIVLPSDPRDGERIAQFTEIGFGRRRVLVVNLHLSHLDFADNLRRRQLDCIVSRMASAWHHDHILLGGDFNAEADAALFEIFADYPNFTTSRASSPDPIGLGVDHLFAVWRRGGTTALGGIGAFERSRCRDWHDGQRPCRRAGMADIGRGRVTASFRVRGPPPCNGRSPPSENDPLGRGIRRKSPAE